ncbi:ftsK/SpoIIIE family protein, partial [Chlamydia psittaci 84-8471/1]
FKLLILVNAISR